MPTSDVDIVVQGAGSNRFQKRKPTTSKGSSNGNHPKHGHKAEQGEGRVVDARTPEECLATAWEAFQRIYALLSCQPWAENVKGKVHTFRCRYTLSPIHLIHLHFRHFRFFRHFRCFATFATFVTFVTFAAAITSSKMPVIKLTLCDGYNQIPFDVTIDPGPLRQIDR